MQPIVLNENHPPQSNYNYHYTTTQPPFRNNYQQSYENPYPIQYVTTSKPTAVPNFINMNAVNRLSV